MKKHWKNTGRCWQLKNSYINIIGQKTKELIGRVFLFLCKQLTIMKKLSTLFFLVLSAVLFFPACDDDKTYAELLEEERDMIKDFMNRQGITTISMSQFEGQDSTTLENEYVEFGGEGVYMHVDHAASGADARFAETNDVILVRFMEVNLATDDTLSTFVNSSYVPDEFRYTKSTNTILGQFIGGGVMQAVYGSSVPAGWLMPLNYLRLSNSSGSDRTRIKLIVSAKNGQSDAINSIYPCYYELTFQFPK